MTALHKRTNSRAPLEGQAGFTLVETSIALVILMVGLLALAGAIAYGLTASTRSRNVSAAKALVVATLEHVETLRNTKRLTFGQIANTGDVDNAGATTAFGGFPTGYRFMSLDPGADGVLGTGDDYQMGAGPDGVVGTADDVAPAGVRQGFTRRIEVTELSQNLKRVRVTVAYPGNGTTPEITGTSYINNDARSNYVR